jgi:ABC-type nitrate/sulfonate/bicarbonate transport system permease component
MRKMAPAVGMKRSHQNWPGSVVLIRAATVVIVLCVWEMLSRSGFFYQKVIPSLFDIAIGTWRVLSSAAFLPNLGVTASEVLFGVLIGGATGLVTGAILGGSRYIGEVGEPLINYLGPTPKIIFLPVLVMCFGLGLGSKVAIAAIASFFPIALSVAAGMREIDAVVVRVGRSFGASPLQMYTKVYLPAMREPLVNGVRLGFGVAVITTLLAETKLSNQGLGFMVMRYFQQFDMPAMYGLVILIFIISLAMNALLTTASSPVRATRSKISVKG